MALCDDAAIPIPCPGCGQKTEKTVGWMKANDHFICSCGSRIEVDSTKLVEGFEDVERRLKAMFKDFGKG